MTEWVVALACVKIAAKIGSWKGRIRVIHITESEREENCGLEPCVFEGHDASVVKWINEGSHCSSENGVLLDDICSLSRQLRIKKFGHCPKRANFVASALASYALKIASDRFWMEDCPVCIMNLVEADKPR